MCFGRGFPNLKSSVMPTPASSSPTPAGDNRNVAPADSTTAGLSFEERAQLFWEKNKTLVFVVLLVFLVAVAANGGWEYFSAQKEREIGRAYAAATTPAALKAFVAAHPNHSLAAVAQVQIADDAYAAARYPEAITAYEQAAAALKTGPIASRARLGAAMAKLLGGRAAEGETALKAIANDANEIKAFRAEAAAHLASHAAANGNAADVKTYSDLLMQIDPASPWTQRTLQLRARMPAETAASTSSDSDAPTLKLPGR
jgi:hypothetical protein